MSNIVCHRLSIELVRLSCALHNWFSLVVYVELVFVKDSKAARVAELA